MCKIKKIKEEVKYEGAVFNVVTKTFKKENEEFKRDVVKTPEVIHVIPIDVNYNIYAIKEFRSGSESKVLGFPAGKIDEGETPEEAMVREVEEEIGMRVVNIISASPTLYTSMGITDEKGHYAIVIVEDIADKDREHFPDIDEDIEVVKYTESEFTNELMKIFKNGSDIGLKTAYLWSVYVLYMNSLERGGYTNDTIH